MSETFLVGLFSRKGALSLLRGLSPEQGCWAGPSGVPRCLQQALPLSGPPDSDLGKWTSLRNVADSCPRGGAGGVQIGQEAVERVDPWWSSVAATGRRPFPPGSPRLFRAFLSALDGVAVPGGSAPSCALPSSQAISAAFSGDHDGHSWGSLGHRLPFVVWADGFSRGTHLCVRKRAGWGLASSWGWFCSPCLSSPPTPGPASCQPALVHP